MGLYWGQFMRKTRISCLLGAALVLAPGLAIGQAVKSAPYQFALATPLAKGALEFKLTIVVNGIPTTNTVSIPAGAITPYDKPAPLPGETVDAYGLRVAQEISDAAQAKATVVAAAINTAFGLKAPGPVVTTGTTKKMMAAIPFTFNGKDYTRKLSFTQGTVTIPDVAKGKGDPITVTEAGILGEGGDKGKFLPAGGGGGGSSSTGSVGSLLPATPSIDMVATGVNAFDRPSKVDFGLAGGYVAQVDPTAGMTEVQVLQSLAQLLDAHGEAATFDVSDQTLSLDNPIPDGQALQWGDTDTGLAFTTEIDPGYATVPEPGSWMLALGGVGLLGARLRARRHAGRLKLASPVSAIR